MSDEETIRECLHQLDHAAHSALDRLVMMSRTTAAAVEAVPQWLAFDKNKVRGAIYAGDDESHDALDRILARIPPEPSRTQGDGE
jgi:hypothetical protein